MSRSQPATKRSVSARDADRPAPQSRYGIIVRVIAGMLAACALVVFIVHFGDLRVLVETVRHAQPLWMAAALAMQAGTYLSVASGWNLVLRKAHAPLSLRQLVPLSLAKLFADQVIPTGGMGGNMLFITQLKARGVPRSAAMATLLVSIIGYYLAYALVALLMLFSLWLHHRASPLLVGLVTTMLLVAIAIPCLALWLRSRGSKPLPEWIESIGAVRRLLISVGEAPRHLVTNRPLILMVAALQALVFLADAATLQLCLLSLGQPVSYFTTFIALVCASIVVTLGPIPFGLGSFEAVSVSMLGLLGVPVTIALAGTLVFRGLTLWLPLIPGMLILASQSAVVPRARIAS